MKEIKITESKMNEALAQIDTLKELNPKDRGCLRLLTEEMFSMCKELLGTDELNFGVKCDKNNYELCVSIKTRVNEDAREQFLSISSSGKNTANQGIKGMLGTVLEVLSQEKDPALYSSAWAYGMNGVGGEYTYIWTLSQYMESAPKENFKIEWDGMEKSIIANFADDVSIGVRNGKLEMTVTKIF